MNTSNEVLEEQNELDLRTLLRVLWLRRWWILAAALASCAAFSTVALLMTPIYRATAVIVPSGAERAGTSAIGSALGQLGGLASLAGINVGGDSATEESLAVLRSRRFTEKFIADRNLMPNIYSQKWDSKTNSWTVSEANKPTLAEANKYFDTKIRKINVDKKTGLIALQIDWKNRNDAADWCNDLVRRINAEMRARAISKSDSSVGYLQKELATTADLGTREAINRLIESQIKQRMVASVTEEYAFRIVDPAMPADEKDHVRPMKVVMALLGLAFGVLISCIAVLIRSSFVAQDP